MINFFKYNSAGNDFIIIDNRLEEFSVDTKLIRKLCNRNFGIGADGLILLESHNQSNYFMNYFNSDGLPASLCGNGSMCCGHFASRLNILTNSDLSFKGSFATREGAFDIVVKENNLVCVNMPPVLDFSMINNDIIINTGSPHYIKFAKKLESLDVNKEGADIRYSQKFLPNGINVTFVEQNDSDIFIRTYERGVESETLSCGTGVVAAAISMWIQKMIHIKNDIIIRTKGGVLNVSFKYNDRTKTFFDINLSNRVECVFQGQISSSQF